jgi:hypothetical protein
MFSSVCALPSPTSAEGRPSLFGWFIGVGSEVARLRAGHRPPLKLHAFTKTPSSEGQANFLTITTRFYRCSRTGAGRSGYGSIISPLN